jgi:hypothetical protein
MVSRGEQEARNGVGEGIVRQTVAFPNSDISGANRWTDRAFTHRDRADDSACVRHPDGSHLRPLIGFHIQVPAVR